MTLHSVAIARSITDEKAAQLNLTSLGIRKPREERDGFSKLARDLVANGIWIDRFRSRVCQFDESDKALLGALD